jgi:hypothetical protein
MKRYSHGFTMPGALLIAMAVAVALTTLVKLTRSKSHQTTYLNQINRTAQLAETGLHMAISRTVRNPTTYMGGTIDSTEIDPLFEDVAGVENSCTIEIGLSPILSRAYYIISTATRVVYGKPYVIRVHAHVRLSNTSEYFAAIKGPVSIRGGTNVSTGRIYGSEVTLQEPPDPAVPTRALSVEFVAACTPPTFPLLAEPVYWTAAERSRFVITEPVEAASGLHKDYYRQPQGLESELMFPELDSAEMNRLKALAGPHTTITKFPVSADASNVEIYPPEYSGGIFLNDHYTGHGNDDNRNIYYSTGPVRVHGTVHGQILIVSEEDIMIDGPITLATNDMPSGSSQNQLVLITPKNIAIINKFYLDQPHEGTDYTLVLKCMLMAPHGIFYSEDFGGDDEAIRMRLSFDFEGSMVLSNIPNTPPNNIPYVFKRTPPIYRYQDTLASHPPPHLPMVTEIIYMFEENLSTAGMYN